MIFLKHLGALAAVSLLTMTLAGPASAITGQDFDAGSAKGKGDTPDPEPPAPEPPAPEPPAPEPPAPEPPAPEPPAPEPPAPTPPDPGQPSTANPDPEGPRNKNFANRDPICAVKDTRVVSSQGTLVGNVDKVTCHKDGTILYHVHLVKPFNDEAQRVTFKASGLPRSGQQVQLQLTNMQVKKLIWMHAPH